MVADKADQELSRQVLEENPQLNSAPALKERRPEFANAQSGVQVRPSENFQQAEDRKLAGGALVFGQTSQTREHRWVNDERFFQQAPSIQRA